MSVDLKDKIYLGDAVYAGYDGYNIWLWINDGISENNFIALEPNVLNELFAYREHLMEAHRVDR